MTEMPIYLVSEEEDEAAEAYDLFQKRGIRLHRGYDDGGFLVLVKDDEVVAAAALAIDYADQTLEFSVAVASKHEKKGYGRRMIEEVLEYASDEDIEFVIADVVNEAVMVPLLKTLGFEKSGVREWRKG